MKTILLDSESLPSNELIDFCKMTYQETVFVRTLEDLDKFTSNDSLLISSNAQMLNHFQSKGFIVIDSGKVTALNALMVANEPDYERIFDD
jgi:hypothetical protein